MPDIKDITITKQMFVCILLMKKLKAMKKSIGKIKPVITKKRLRININKTYSVVQFLKFKINLTRSN